MDKRYKTKGPEVLVYLHQLISDKIASVTGINKETSLEIATDVVDNMRMNWGGINIYFPRGLSLDAIRKHKQIYDEFTGNNHEELAQKHGVSTQWVYKIIETMKKAEFNERQQDMFGDEVQSK